MPLLLHGDGSIGHRWQRGVRSPCLDECAARKPKRLPDVIDYALYVEAYALRGVEAYARLIYDRVPSFDVFSFSAAEMPALV